MLLFQPFLAAYAFLSNVICLVFRKASGSAKAVAYNTPISRARFLIETILVLSSFSQLLTRESASWRLN
jgi:hypothetical protein